MMFPHVYQEFIFAMINNALQDPIVIPSVVEAVTEEACAINKAM